jgi:hypothetical protein
MVALVLVVVGLGFAARGLARRTTWYLASDQYAFLTFADDLADGHVLHDPAGIELLLGGHRPKHPVDALFQTYLYDDGRLYSRYPPGFPAMLAVARRLGGEAAQHLLNPAAFLVLLIVVALLARRLTGRGLAGAGAAAAAVWGVLVVPAEMHYWGITVARDLPAHLLALAAVLAMLGGRTVAAGLMLGFACSIRPDAVLYALPLGALALGLGPLRAALASGTMAFLVGLAPLLAYNTYTRGHPLAFTQGLEFRHFFGRQALSAAAMLPTASGGGFRLTHLRHTLPVNLAYLAGAFGGLLVPALGALGWAAARRRPLAVALGPYVLAALLFYACWGHGDPRYLVGVSLCLVMAMAAGAVWWSTHLARPVRSLAARVLAIALTLAVPLAAQRLLPQGPSDRTATLVTALAASLAGIGCLALVPATAGVASVVAPLVPAVALATTGLVRVARGSHVRDPFQQDRVARARATIGALVPAGSLVLTTPALGRPAENLSHYAGVQAMYLGELEALGVGAGGVTYRALSAHRRVFMLVGPGGRPELEGITAREVARRGGPALYDWFVDPERARGGAFLYELTLVLPDGR